MMFVPSPVEVISFQQHHLFSAYRNTLESVESLSKKKRIPTTTTTTKKEEEEDDNSEMMVDDYYADDLEVLNEMEMDMLSNIKNPMIDLSKEEEVAVTTTTVAVATTTTTQQRQVDIISSNDVSPTSSATPSPQKLDLFAKEHHLIKLVDATMKEKCNYDYLLSDIKELALAKSPWLVPDFIYETPLQMTLQTLKKNLLVEMALLDKKSGKLSDVMARLLHVYLACESGEGLADQEHTKMINNLVAETFLLSRDLNNDADYKKALEPKLRGRTSGENRKIVVTAINALRREYIKSGRDDDEDSLLNKPGINLNEHVTHKYSVFDSVLHLTYDNIPKEDNFGVYLQDMYKILEVTTNEEFPMRQLMLSIINAEALIDIVLLRDVQTQGMPCYCSYTGDRIVDGDDVHQIRLVEHSDERLTKWKMSKSPRPFREFTNKLFMDSVSVYWIKRYAHTPTSLFPIDFSSEYKQKYPDFAFGAPRPVTLFSVTKPTTTTTTTTEEPLKPMEVEVTTTKKEKKPRVKKSVSSKPKKKTPVSILFKGVGGGEEAGGGDGEGMDVIPPQQSSNTLVGKLGNRMNQLCIDTKPKKEFKKECLRIADLIGKIDDTNFKECIAEMVNPYVLKSENQTSVNKLLYLIIDVIEFFNDRGSIINPMSCAGLECLIELALTRRNTKPEYINRFQMIEDEYDGQFDLFDELSAHSNLFLGIYYFLFLSKQAKAKSPRKKSTK